MSRFRFKVSRRVEKWTLVLLFGLGCAVLLKWGVISSFTVYSPSMAPILHGEPGNGDRVAVFKLQDLFEKPKRFSLAAFRKEGDFSVEGGRPFSPGGANLIKRVVGLPGEKIMIRDGDLFIGTSSEPLRKSIDMLDELLIPIYAAHFEDDFFESWIVEPAEAKAWASLGKEGLLLDAPSDSEGSILRFEPEGGLIRDDYLDRGGLLCRGKNPVRDLVLRMKVRFLSDQGDLVGLLRENGDEFWFRLRTRKSGGGGEVTHNMAASHPRIIRPDQFPGFEEGRTCSIVFMNVDDRILLQIEGSMVLEFAYSGNTHVGGGSVLNGVAFGGRGGAVLVEEIRIDRDIHYTGEPGVFAVNRIYQIPDHHYFLLGDNSSKSIDSRTFGPIPERDLLGVPFLVFYPLGRMRFL